MFSVRTDFRMTSGGVAVPRRAAVARSFLRLQSQTRCVYLSLLQRHYDKDGPIVWDTPPRLEVDALIGAQTVRLVRDALVVFRQAGYQWPDIRFQKIAEDHAQTLAALADEVRLYLEDVLTRIGVARTWATAAIYRAPYGDVSCRYFI